MRVGTSPASRSQCSAVEGGTINGRNRKSKRPSYDAVNTIGSVRPATERETTSSSRKKRLRFGADGFSVENVMCPQPNTAATASEFPANKPTGVVLQFIESCPNVLGSVDPHRLSGRGAAFDDIVKCKTSTLIGPRSRNVSPNNVPHRNAFSLLPLPL